MRLLLALSSKSGALLPAHYNHPLAAAVYDLLRFGSKEFAAYLHDIGYSLNGYTYKLFSFALRFEQMRFEGNAIRLLSPRAELHVSSPLVEDFINNVVLGSFEHQKLSIGHTEFRIERMETPPLPQFSPTMMFTLHSPLVLSTKRKHNNTMHQYYLRPDDTEEINRVLTANLARKYEILTGKTLPNAHVELVWDNRYRTRHKRITRRIIIREKNIGINVIGMQAPFELYGSPELIRTGYECGFGEKNAMGFGFANAVRVGTPAFA